MHNDGPSIGRSIFIFFASIPYAIFRMGYFVFTLPKRLRRLRHRAVARKHVTIKRLSDKGETLLSAVALVGKLRDACKGMQTARAKSMFELAESLWGEAESEDWTLPTALEVETHRALFLDDLRESGLLSDGVTPSVWAINERTQMFVVVDLLSENRQHATPENITVILRGEAPESKERSFAYAVKVIVCDEPSVNTPPQ